MLYIKEICYECGYKKWKNIYPFDDEKLANELYSYIREKYLTDKDFEEDDGVFYSKIEEGVCVEIYKIEENENAIINIENFKDNKIITFFDGSKKLI